MARAKVRTYLSPALVLLAFDWGAGGSRDDFLGFAIERRPGFWGAASSWLPNRIGFGGPATHGDFPSNTSPIQKFMWWDARIDDTDRGRRFSYTVTPVVGDAAAPRLLPGSATTVSVELPHTEEQGIGSYFNRAVVSSQAFSRQFGTGELSPARLGKALVWLANGMEQVIPRFLDGSERAEGAIYHLTDRQWVVPALESHPGRATLVYNDTARDHENHDSVEDLTPGVRFFPRTKAAIMHDKFLVRLEGDRPTGLLTGSANFTTGGIATQANLMHTFASPELAALYLERARLLQGDPTVRATAGHAGWSDPVEVGDATVRVFFPPEPTRRRASIDAVVEAVARARSSVVFSLFKPTDRALFDALERHGQAGKLLFGLVNKLDRPAGSADEPSEDAAAARVDILHRSVLARETVDHGLFARGGQPSGFWWERASLPGMGSRFPVYIHHKFVVIDAETANPVIYTGSANMSNNAVHRNDENLLEISGSQRLAAVYFAEFLRLYEHYRARRQTDRRGRPRPTFSLAKDAGWAAKAFQPGTSQFLSRVRLAAAPR
ncbi:MAG TPA: phospholipase D-like domain-containing protein [Actinomycetes bacterium]|jgi:phosphatidylserine/phosphatidylglycerophosphate/cardiolipin synthase-like enzyme|nr:phospholipase D-like domain-containing protein [Actinomycetes bacterium]